MQLTLHLTGRCNLRCAYCYAKPSSEDMAEETAKAALSFALRSRRWAGERISVVFFGGEPLLRVELIRALMRHIGECDPAGKARIDCAMTTNGLLLQRSFLEDDLTRDIRVTLSIDGAEPVHDAHRVSENRRGTFAAVADKAKLLLSFQPFASAFAVVTPETLSRYAESVLFLRGLGFRNLVFTLDYGADWAEEHVEILRAEYERIAAWYEGETLREEGFAFVPFEAKIASHVRRGECSTRYCHAGKPRISVGPDGSIYPCIQFVGHDEFRIGHVQEGIDDANVRRLNEPISEPAVCAECGIRHRCHHYCSCVNHHATRKTDGIPPFLCAHERVLVPIVDRLAGRLHAAGVPAFYRKHYSAGGAAVFAHEKPELGARNLSPDTLISPASPGVG